MTTQFPSLKACLPGILLALTLLSGCATVDQKIGLSYAPVDRPFGRQSGEITVSRVEPGPGTRNSKGEWIIGSINNVHGVRQADILADYSLGEWITDALLLELKHAGYSATYAAAIPPDAPRGITISGINISLNLNKLTVKDETKQELRFNVDLFLKGTKVKTFTVAARDSKTLLSASREDLEKIMLTSLQDAMLQIIPEIIALTAPK
jgi:hypothetical protein